MVGGRVEGRAKLEAGERAWARQIADEAGLLAAREKEEESIIKKKIEALRKHYGNKTPNDLIIDPATGKKYPSMKMRKVLYDHGDRLAKFFQGLANLTLPLLKMDVQSESKLSHLFSRQAKNMGANLVILQMMKKKEEAIRKKLLNASAYWARVRDRQALPWLGNSSKITSPVEDIDQRELELLAEIDKVLRRGQAILVRSKPY